MNWNLVFLLSLFALAMGIATVFVIPSSTEPFFWLVILLITAYIIARQTAARRFQHGLALGIVNSVWVTGAHVLLFRSYVANHPKEAAMMTSMPMPTHPRVMMIIIGLIIGVVSGILIGLLALLAGKLIRPGATPAAGVPNA
jgi:hypothetical protein